MGKVTSEQRNEGNGTHVRVSARSSPAIAKANMQHNGRNTAWRWKRRCFIFFLLKDLSGWDRKWFESNVVHTSRTIAHNAGVEKSLANERTTTLRDAHTGSFIIVFLAVRCESFILLALNEWHVETLCHHHLWSKGREKERESERAKQIVDKIVKVEN